ncbi:unnamed protein product (macronuclear) [Paramecium tetraurelia]|uniref:Uncharacterized protein n=1 Tax=Paramecium tetraurelia TaxID=5888 RepID=A0C5H7_PARTE|nr:uncharacterized protein GSPATT00006543001 [Paramecium tetraurelia]CAK66044.1 unnamed protein product [Paramecium tetraurelia]|eukprot:XP_001433441.1 hypothetical protein (macronuclear) [Paramecium tetraurelia strain d4-2]
MQKTILIIYLLFVIANSATTYSDQDLMILIERSQIRGDYQDVVNERSGALISNARQLTFYGDQFNNSPLRDAIYDIAAGSKGYVLAPVNGKIQLDLLQEYEINTIVIWFYDLTVITYKFKVTLIYPDDSQAIIYTNSSAVGGIYRIPFDDSLVKSFLITDISGTQPLQVIKIQAFYAF